MHEVYFVDLVISLFADFDLFTDVPMVARMIVVSHDNHYNYSAHA